MRKNSRIVGYGAALAVGLVALFFGWRLFVYTELERDGAWVHFTGTGDLIGSLQPDDPVAIQGVAVGQVEDIVSVRDGVRVRVRFWKHQKIHADAHAANVGNGLMGMRFVLLEPGSDTAPLLDRDSDIPGGFSPGIAEVMSRIEDVVAKVKRLQDEAVSIVEGDSANAPMRRKIVGALGKVDALLGGLDRYDGRLHRAGSELSRIGRETRDVAAAIDTAQPRIAGELRSLDTMLAQARGMLLALREMSRDADADVRSAAGPLEPLTRDDSLLVKVERCLKVVDELQTLVDGKAKFKQHFHIWGDNPSKHGE